MKKIIASFLLALLAPLVSAGCGDMDLYNSLLIPEPPPVQGSVRMTWLGTAGVLLTDGKTGILIDPYVSRFGMRAIALGSPLEPDRALIKKWCGDLAGDGQKIAAVIVSHSHFDHAADAPFFALETGAPLIGTESTMNIGRGAGLPERLLLAVKPGRTMEFGDFTVRFIESAHGPAFLGRVPYPGMIDAPLVPPAAASRYRLGGVFSLLISHPSGTILHHGSAGFLPGMYDAVRADAVLLGITGREDTDNYLDQVMTGTGARLLVPIHHENFFKPIAGGMSFLPTAGFNEFCKTAAKRRSAFSLHTVPLGKAVAILPLPASARTRGPAR